MWWEADLGRAHEVSSLRLMWAIVPTYKQVMISGSQDGFSYTPITGTTYVHTDGRWTEIPLAGRYRFIRVNYVGSGSGGHGLDLTEVEIFGRSRQATSGSRGGQFGDRRSSRPYQADRRQQDHRNCPAPGSPATFLDLHQPVQTPPISITARGVHYYCIVAPHVGSFAIHAMTPSLGSYIGRINLYNSNNESLDFMDTHRRPEYRDLHIGGWGSSSPQSEGAFSVTAEGIQPGSVVIVEVETRNAEPGTRTTVLFVDDGRHHQENPLCRHRRC